MDQVVIRPADAEDLPAIVAMRDALNRLELAGCPHASIQKLTLEEFSALWEPTLTDPVYCWRMVEVEGRPVGFGLIYLQKPIIRAPAAFLHWAYLEPNHRRQGLGRRLVQHLCAWARGQGADRIELQFIDGNEAAQQFWQSMMFQTYARKSVLYLSPEI